MLSLTKAVLYADHMVSKKLKTTVNYHLYQFTVKHSSVQNTAKNDRFATYE